jgi:hypothetical protein
LERLDELPRRALGERLALLVRLAFLHDRPVLFVVDVVARRAAERDGGDGRREHHALHCAVRIRAGLENAARAPRRRADELVFVRRVMRGNGEATC